LHLIREKSLEQAIASHPDPEGIPKRNITYARELGINQLRSELQQIKKN
jgi:hypothetical protein